MKIYLSPVRDDCKPLSAIVSGDIITLNGVPYDLSRLRIGETLPDDAISKPSPFAGDITRDSSGEITLTLKLPHGVNAPTETKFPVALTSPIVINCGAVDLPPYDMEINHD